MNYPLDIINKNKRYSIINGIYSTIANSYGGFVALYAIHVLGANHQQVGLINSLPAITSLITILIGGLWFSQLTVKKRFCGLSILFTRSVLLFIALIPFLPNYQAWVFVLLIGFMSIPGSLANLSWQSLIGDLVPERERGQFFSHRNRVLTIVGMIATAFLGVILNRYDASYPYPYQILFVVAFIFGILETYYLFKHVEFPIQKPQVKEQIKIFTKIKGMLKQKPFLFFLSSSVLFNFGWQMAWPLFNIYQIEYAHATAFWLSLFTVTNQLSQIITYRWWGRMADKYGNSMMLFIASAGMATAPFLTILSTNLIYLTVINLWTGAFLAGTNLLLFNQLLKVTTDEERSSYITLYTVFIGFIGFIAPQIGVWLLGQIGMIMTMNLSSVLRFFGGIAFLVVAIVIDKTNIKIKKTDAH